MRNFILILASIAISHSSFALSLKEMDLSGFWQFSYKKDGEYFNHELMLSRTSNTLDLYDDQNVSYYMIQGMLDLNHKLVGLTTANVNGVEKLIFIQIKHYIGREKGYRFDDETMPILEVSNDTIKIANKEGGEFGRMTRIKTVHGPSTAVPHDP